MAPNEIDPNINWALYYAEKGWEVFPVYEPVSDGRCSCGVQNCPSPAKHPRTLNGMKDATTDPETIKRWWEKWPNASIGRRPSVNDFVLDLDGDSGKAYAEREEIPFTPTAQTGGGIHILLINPPDDKPKNRAKYKTGLDIRTHDGYHILPPSIHINGKRYRWIQPPETLIAESPEWLNRIIHADAQAERKETDIEVLKFKISKLRPCIQAMLTNENKGAMGESGDLEHEAHLLIVSEAQYQGFSKSEILKLFENQPDYNKQTTAKQVESLMRSGLEKGIIPWFCAAIINRGWCNSEDSTKCASQINLAKNSLNLAKYIGTPPGVEKIILEEKNEKINKFNILSQNTDNIPINRDEKSDYLGTEDIDRFFLPPPPSGYTLVNLAKPEYITEETLDQVLDLTIKGDEINRKILFIGSLLNYTKEDQLNFGLSGDSAIGKSHNCLEIAALHPKEVVMKLSYTSPKAFFHDKGVLIDDETGEPMLQRKEFIDQIMEPWYAAHPRTAGSEWREERKEKLRDAVQVYNDHPKHLRVDLKQKLLVFVDMPSPELLTYLRSLLSHDEPSVWVKITDKDRGGGNQTKNVEIIGFPTLFFNSTNFAMDAQEQTRLFLLSPDGNQEKLKKTLPFIAEKVSNRPKFKNALNINEERNRVMALIESIRMLDIQEIIISPEDVAVVMKRFMEEHELLIPRFQRDLPRLLALIKGYALFFAANRVIDNDKNLYATSEDVTNGYELYKSISDSNELGLPPHIFDFYRKIMLPTLKTGVGYTHRELALEYFNSFKTHIGENQLGKIIQLLNETGLVIEETDPNDRRIKRVYNATMKQEGSEGTLDAAFSKTIYSDIECLRQLPTLVDSMKVTLDGSCAREDVIDRMMKDWNIKDRSKAGRLIDTALKDGSIYAPRPGSVKTTA